MHNINAHTKGVDSLEKNEQKKSKVTGDNFVNEPTGSATLINLDGQWEHDFDDHKEKAGK